MLFTVRLLIVFPLPLNVPENGVPDVAIPTVHVQPDMLISAVNLYVFDIAPETAADSLSHWRLAAVLISYEPLTKVGAAAVGHPVSPRAGVDDVPTSIVATNTPTIPMRRTA